MSKHVMRPPKINSTGHRKEPYEKSTTTKKTKSMLILEYDEEEALISQQASDTFLKEESSVDADDSHEAMQEDKEEEQKDGQTDADEAKSVDTQPLTKEELDTMVGELERQYEESELKDAGEVKYEDDQVAPSSPRKQNSFSNIPVPQVLSDDLVVDPDDLAVRYTDAWDATHVKLPCSPQNSYRMATDQSVNLPKWDLIEKVLTSSIVSSKELELSIMSYNPSFNGKWDFAGLHYFVNKVLSGEERQTFFATTVPTIQKLARQLPRLVKKPIPMLTKYINREISLSQAQIASLLAHAFFCTFPRRSTFGQQSEFKAYPSINFNTLFQMPCEKRKQGKLRCLFHYFDRLAAEMPGGVVTFRRQVSEELPDWNSSKAPLAALSVHSQGTIEDDGIGCVQIDFANKVIGGGVLGEGCVQEEIRFVINTELLVSRLFTEELEPNEALFMIGAERFCSYGGYGSTFAYAGDFKDTTPRDAKGRIMTVISGIDAIKFRHPSSQYRQDLIIRELNKAFIGFYTSDTQLNKMPIATGNWGCGAFGGHRELKSLIQLMVASVLQKSIRYYTFGEVEFAARLENIYKLLVDRKVSVGRLMDAIVGYNRLTPESKGRMDLFTFLIDKFDH